MKVNLHTHSNESDGSLSVEELIKTLEGYNYDLVALTDHDSVSGNQLARELASIYFVEGIEITSYIPYELALYDPSFGLHMVGLNIDSKKMEAMLEKIRKRKIEKFLEVLMCNGFTQSEIEVLISDGVININSRISLAQMMLNRGLYANMEEAVSQFSLSLYAPSIIDSINMIHECGGIAIWAHPYIICKNGDYQINVSDVEEIFEYMINNDIDGLESYYQQFSLKEQEILEQIAIKYGKFSSTGTDFHADYDWEYDLLTKNANFDGRLINYLQGSNKTLCKKRREDSLTK